MNLVAVEAVRDNFLSLVLLPKETLNKANLSGVVTSPTGKRKAVSEHLAAPAWQNVTGETHLSPSALGVLKWEL